MRSWELPDIDLTENVPGSLVNSNPLVYLIGLNSGENAPGLLSHDTFLDHQVQHFFFMNPMWSFSSKGYSERVIPRLNEVASKFPQHCYVLFLNDAQDLTTKQDLDPRISIYVCGEHALADTNKFAFRQCARKFKAAYIAQNAAYKRIELAREIDSLCLIAKGIRPEEIEALKREVPSLYCPNSELGLLNTDQVSAFLNASGSGLILSKVEGQNRATIEYLLCGLPVVSTSNWGGRDRFLSPSNSIYVPDDPEAVAYATDFVTSADFDRGLIAKEAALCVRHERTWLSHIVDSTLGKFGIPPISIRYRSLPHHGFSRSTSMSHVLRERHAALS